MRVEVPVFNEDGSVKFTADLNTKEAQAILQFGLNVAITSGLAQHMGIHIAPDEEMKTPEVLN